MKLPKLFSKTLASTLVLTFSCTSTILYSETPVSIPVSTHNSLARELAGMNDLDVRHEFSRLTGVPSPDEKKIGDPMPGLVGAGARSELRQRANKKHLNTLKGKVGKVLLEFTESFFPKDRSLAWLDSEQFSIKKETTASNLSKLIEQLTAIIPSSDVDVLDDDKIGQLILLAGNTNEAVTELKTWLDSNSELFSSNGKDEQHGKLLFEIEKVLKGIEKTQNTLNGFKSRSELRNEADHSDRKRVVKAIEELGRKRILHSDRSVAIGQVASAAALDFMAVKTLIQGDSHLVRQLNAWQKNSSRSELRSPEHSVLGGQIIKTTPERDLLLQTVKEHLENVSLGKVEVVDSGDGVSFYLNKVIPVEAPYYAKQIFGPQFEAMNLTAKIVRLDRSESVLWSRSELRDLLAQASIDPKSVAILGVLVFGAVVFTAVLIVRWIYESWVNFVEAREVRVPSLLISRLRKFTEDQLELLNRLVATYNLSPVDQMYLMGMWGQFLFKDPNKTTLKILTDETKDGNFILASQLSAAERTRLLGATPYAQLANPDNLEAAKKVIITVNSMDGGIGESLGRKEWKARRLGKQPSEIVLGAKGTDLGYDLKFSDGQRIFVSIAEAKMMQLKFLAESGQFAGIQFQPLGNIQSAGSYKTLLDSPRLEDRLDDESVTTVRQNLRQNLESAGVRILPILLQADLPRIHVESGNLTLDKSIKRQPGGHGQCGVTFLIDTYQNAPPQDGKTHIRVFYNGDNLNSAPDPYIAGFMSRRRIPIMKLTTAATPIDKKGGKDGVRIVKQGEKTIYVPDQMEIADAISAGQENLFVLAGQEGGIGETGEQPFNTNVIYFNTSILYPLLRDLAGVLGGEDAFAALISPTLINQKLKIVEIDGQHYLPIDGAIGTVVHNLNSYLMRNHTEPQIAAILKKHGLNETGQILYFVDVPRTQHFTPVKNAVDMWLQRMSDYYTLNFKTLRLEDSKNDLVPPEITLDDPSYKELANVEKALGYAKVKQLKLLRVRGRVNFENATLIGHVMIENKTNGSIDLNDPKFAVQLGDAIQDGKLYLANLTITIEDENTIRVSQNPADFRSELRPSVIASTEGAKQSGYREIASAAPRNDSRDRSELRIEVVESFQEAAWLVEMAAGKGWISESALANILSWGDEAHKLAHLGITAQFQSAGTSEQAWKNINDDWYTILKAGTAGIRGKRGWGTNRINLFTIGLFQLAHARMVAGESYNELVKSFDPEFDPATTKKAVALGYDSRIDSYDPINHQPGFNVKLEALINAANGVRAYVFRDPTSTPQLSYTVHSVTVDDGYKLVSGSMSTASHNPSSDNGNKIYKPDGSQSTGIFADEINRHLGLVTASDLANLTYQGVNILENIEHAFAIAIDNGDIKWIGGENDPYQADEQFIKAELDEAIHTVGEQFDPKYINLSNTKIVISPLYGVSKRILKEILRRRGVRDDQIIWVQDEPNPEFPGIKGGKPNPEIPEAREVALQKAVEVNADLVFWTDPDADRPAVAVKKNPVQHAKNVEDYISFNGNQQLAILASYLIEETKNLYFERFDRKVIPPQSSALANQSQLVRQQVNSVWMASTVVSGDLMKVIARKNGLRVVETLTGFKYIGDQVELRAKAIQKAANISESKWIRLSKEEKIKLALQHSELFLFGGEESLGSLTSDGPHDKDAISGVMWFVEILGRLNIAQKSQGDLNGYLERIYKQYGYFTELFPMLQKGKGYAGVELSEQEAMEVIKAREGSSILNRFRQNPPKTIAGKKVIAVLDYLAQTAKSPDGTFLFDSKSHAGLITAETEGIPALFRKQLKEIRTPIPEPNRRDFSETVLNRMRGIYSFAHVTFPGSNQSEPTVLPKEDFVMLLLENGSKVVARPSGTEPIIKFYINGRGIYDDRANVDSWLVHAAADLEQIADDVARKRFPEKFIGRAELRQINQTVINGFSWGGVFGIDQLETLFQLWRGLRLQSLQVLSLSYSPFVVLGGQISHALTNSTPKITYTATGYLIADWVIKLVVMTAMPTILVTSINIFAIKTRLLSENSSPITFFLSVGVIGIVSYILFIVNYYFNYTEYLKILNDSKARMVESNPSGLVRKALAGALVFSSTKKGSIYGRSELRANSPVELLREFIRTQYEQSGYEVTAVQVKVPIFTYAPKVRGSYTRAALFVSEGTVTYHTKERTTSQNKKLQPTLYLVDGLATGHVQVKSLRVNVLIDRIDFRPDRSIFAMFQGKIVFDTRSELRTIPKRNMIQTEITVDAYPMTVDGVEHHFIVIRLNHLTKKQKEKLEAIFGSMREAEYMMLGERSLGPIALVKKGRELAAADTVQYISLTENKEHWRLIKTFFTAHVNHAIQFFRVSQDGPKKITNLKVDSQKSVIKIYFENQPDAELHAFQHYGTFLIANIKNAIYEAALSIANEVMTHDKISDLEIEAYYEDAPLSTVLIRNVARHDYLTQFAQIVTTQLAGKAASFLQTNDFAPFDILIDKDGRKIKIERTGKGGAGVPASIRPDSPSLKAVAKPADQVDRNRAELRGGIHGKTFVGLQKQAKGPILDEVQIISSGPEGKVSKVNVARVDEQSHETPRSTTLIDGSLHYMDLIREGASPAQINGPVVDDVVSHIQVARHQANSAKSELRLAPSVVLDRTHWAAAVAQVQKLLRGEAVVQSVERFLIPDRADLEGTLGAVVSRTLAFEEGMLPVFAALAKQTGLRVAVIAPTEEIDAGLVEQVNQQFGLTGEDRIIIEKDPAHAVGALRKNGVTRASYFASSHAEAALVEKMIHVMVLSKEEIGRMKSSVGGLLDAIELVRDAYEEIALAA